MRHPEYSSVDPRTGDVTYSGSLSLEKSDHSHMPSRSGAYLPGDEKGHVNASSLGGRQHNFKRGPAARRSEPRRRPLRGGGRTGRTVQRRGDRLRGKTAVVGGQPGDRPIAFTINDSVTLPRTATRSPSTTLSQTSPMPIRRPGTPSRRPCLTPLTRPNPGDGLRGSMDADSYASLMEGDGCGPSRSGCQLCAGGLLRGAGRRPQTPPPPEADADPDAGSGGCGADAGSADADTDPD